MRSKRPLGGFTVVEIAHLGVGARCCYESAEFEVRRDFSGERLTLYVFGQLKGEDEHMYNGVEISMTEAQLAELAEYIKKNLEAKK